MHDTLWQSVLGEFELSISHANFTTWFKPTEMIEYTNERITIAVPNVFVKSQFEARYASQVKESLVRHGAEVNEVRYVIKTKNTTKRAGVSREILPADADLARSVSTTLPGMPGKHTIGNSLNSRYTFESFIVGSSNDLAYTACQAVAAEPGTKYNPLFLYGGVGLGKTHLMQAVGHAIKQRDKTAKILYVSSETFVQEFLDHIRFKKTGFSDKYRNVDVLIVDDIQFIAGKEKTQDEFFHTFNALHQANKQVIISSDKPPRSIPTLTDRLRSRLEWGMAIDIQMPDFETRCAILEAKAQMSGVTLDPDTIEYLATNIKTNIRELEGALNHLLAHAEMRGIAPDVNTAEGLLGDVRRSRPQHVTAKQIVDRTAKHFQLGVKDICSPRRDKHIVVPRQIAMYLLRSELHMSFPNIAAELGRKDHTTAIHSVEKIERAIKLDYLIREQISEIKDSLYA